MQAKKVSDLFKGTCSLGQNKGLNPDLPSPNPAGESRFPFFPCDQWHQPCTPDALTSTLPIHPSPRLQTSEQHQAASLVKPPAIKQLSFPTSHSSSHTPPFKLSNSEVKVRKYLVKDLTSITGSYKLAGPPSAFPTLHFSILSPLQFQCISMISFNLPSFRLPPTPKMKPLWKDSPLPLRPGFLLPFWSTLSSSPPQGKAAPGSHPL